MAAAAKLMTLQERVLQIDHIQARRFAKLAGAPLEIASEGMYGVGMSTWCDIGGNTTNPHDRDGGHEGSYVELPGGAGIARRAEASSICGTDAVCAVAAFAVVTDC